MSSQFHTIAKHTVEYYQGNKFLGSIVCEGEVPQEAVGYYGKTLITAGEVRLKRIHKATEAKPIEVVKYNLQGRIMQTPKQS
jgi:hypothetical protein